MVRRVLLVPPGRPQQQQQMRSMFIIAAVVLVISMLISGCGATPDNMIRLSTTFVCAKNRFDYNGLTQYKQHIQFSSDDVSDTSSDAEPMPILLTHGRIEFNVLRAVDDDRCGEFKIKPKNAESVCWRNGEATDPTDFINPPKCGKRCKGIVVMCNVEQALVEELDTAGIVGLKKSALLNINARGCPWDVVIKNARVLVPVKGGDVRVGEACTSGGGALAWYYWLAIVVGCVCLIVLIVCLIVCMAVYIFVTRQGGGVSQQTQNPRAGSTSFWQRTRGSMSRMANSISQVQQRFMLVRAHPKKPMSSNYSYA